jgi:hypothetical protein
MPPKARKGGFPAVIPKKAVAKKAVAIPKKAAPIKRAAPKGASY